MLRLPREAATTASITLEHATAKTFFTRDIHPSFPESRFQPLGARPTPLAPSSSVPSTVVDVMRPHAAGGGGYERMIGTFSAEPRAIPDLSGKPPATLVGVISRRLAA